MRLSTNRADLKMSIINCDHHQLILAPTNLRIRTRFKMFSKIFKITLYILLFLSSPLSLFLCVNSQPLMLSSSTNGSSEPSLFSLMTCSQNIEHCLNDGDDNGNVHQQPQYKQRGASSLDQMSCPQIYELKQCLDRLKLNCHSFIHYHSLSVLVDRIFMEQCRQRHRDYQLNGQKHRKQSRQLQQQTQRSPPIRSMFSGPTWHQQLSTQSNMVKTGMVDGGGQYRSRVQQNMPTLVDRSPTSTQSQVPLNQNKLVKPEYFQYCLIAAYNYTIGVDIVPRKIVQQDDNNIVQEYRSSRYQRFKRHSDIIDQNDLVTDIMFHQRKQRLQRKDFEIHPNENNGDHRIHSMLNESTAQMASDMIYKPVHPMTPSLTCIIFGDPHLRTFDSRYQTCNCLGARSLLEHPLFDVQITNTRLQDQFNSTGVTKVTVLVRRFSSCMISNELIYETDSLAQPSPARAFTDGSVYNFKNLVYITTSMDNMVVTIHLEHIGVRVYISQFVHTKFLNVVIKFRTAKSNFMRQDFVLDSINPISLCKSGCHRRELIKIGRELERANIDVELPLLKRNHNPVPAHPSSSFNIDRDDDSSEDYDSAIGGDINGDLDDYDNDNDSDGLGDDYDSDEDENYDDAKHKPRKTRGLDGSDQEPSKEIQKKKNQKRGRRNRKKNKSTTTTTTTTTTEQPKRQKFSKPALSRLRSAMHVEKFPIQNNNNEDILSIVRLRLSTSVGDNNYDDNDELVPQDCYDKNLIGYYRLACLYDTMIKGAASTYPFFFASSFDEPKFMALNQNHHHKHFHNNHSSKVENDEERQSYSSSKSISSNFFIIVLVMVYFLFVFVVY